MAPQALGVHQTSPTMKKRSGAAATAADERGRSHSRRREKVRQWGNGSYRGVRRRGEGRWIAEIKNAPEGSRKWLGTFKSALEAALAFDKAARELRGPDAKTNFPDGTTLADALAMSGEHFAEARRTTEREDASGATEDFSAALLAAMNSYTGAAAVSGLTPAATFAAPAFASVSASARPCASGLKVEPCTADSSSSNSGSSDSEDGSVGASDVEKSVGAVSYSHQQQETQQQWRQQQQQQQQQQQEQQRKSQHLPGLNTTSASGFQPQAKRAQPFLCHRFSQHTDSVSTSAAMSSADAWDVESLMREAHQLLLTSSRVMDGQGAAERPLTSCRSAPPTFLYGRGAAVDASATADSLERTTTAGAGADDVLGSSLSILADVMGFHQMPSWDLRGLDLGHAIGQPQPLVRTTSADSMAVSSSSSLITTHVAAGMASSAADVTLVRHGIFSGLVQGLESALGKAPMGVSNGMEDSLGLLREEEENGAAICLRTSTKSGGSMSLMELEEVEQLLMQDEH